MGFQGVLDLKHRRLCLLQRVKAALDRPDPPRSAPRRPNERVPEKAGSLDAVTGHRLRQPDLIGGLAEVVHKPLPPHTKILPCVQQRGARGRIGGIVFFNQHVIGNP